jgi:putative tryptophan/tyrosine transport system substrate-binding protein
MDRRSFLLTSVAGALAAPLGVEAQQAGKVYRLGILSPGGLPQPGMSSGPGYGHLHLIEVLRELGYVEGQNLVVERRYAEGKTDRLPGLARELVRVPVDVIVAVSVAVEVAKDATKTIPIVMGFATDPVGRGVVSSLARPGGNITGVAYSVGPEIHQKRLELLKEAVPNARIAGLAGRDTSQSTMQATQQAASSLGVKLIVVEVRGDEYERAFATMVAERAAALAVISSSILNTDRRLIIKLAARHRLPAIYEWREHVEEGGLMAYGASVRDLYRRVAAFVDRILKGAKPADLPIEQPTTFEFVINLKTAKALGLTIPPSLLARADQVIE